MAAGIAANQSIGSELDDPMQDIMPIASVYEMSEDGLTSSSANPTSRRSKKERTNKEPAGRYKSEFLPD